MSDAPSNKQSSGDAGDAAAARAEREATERANHKLALALFASIFVLAGIGVTISAIAMSGHHSRMAALANASRASASSAVRVPTSESLWVAPSWKKGFDGQLHDAYSKSNFTVRIGQPLRLTIDNRDDTMHSITSAEAGVNIVIQPGVHTYTLIVHRTGHFKWICAYPCDPFSMARPGYMGGYITAV